MVVEDAVQPEDLGELRGMKGGERDGNNMHADGNCFERKGEKRKRFHGFTVSRFHEPVKQSLLLEVWVRGGFLIVRKRE